MEHPTRERRILRAAVLLLAVSSLLLATAAVADPLDDAKSAGYVGEQSNGLLGLVNSDAPADVKALVTSVNAKRTAAYDEIARKNGTTVVAVAALAGQKAIEMTKPGNYVQSASGAWVKK